MWPFRKRTKPVKAQPPMPCQHKWKDFPWYMEVTSKDRDYRYDIWQPYVCVKCKERRNERLEGYTYSNRQSRDKDVAEAKVIYKDYLKPEAVVGDLVKDEQLIDREYLRLIDELHGLSSPFDNLDLLKVELEKVKAAMAAEGGVQK